MKKTTLEFATPALDELLKQDKEIKAQRKAKLKEAEKERKYLLKKLKEYDQLLGTNSLGVTSSAIKNKRKAKGTTKRAPNGELEKCTKQALSNARNPMAVKEAKEAIVKAGYTGSESSLNQFLYNGKRLKDAGIVKQDKKLSLAK